MVLSNLKEGLTEAMGSVNDKFKDSLSVIQDIKEAGKEKINSLLNDVLGLAPLIEHTGFNMKEVSIDIGIPPGINISFSKEKDIDPATIEKLLEENKDKEMFLLIVRGLQKADEFQKAINMAEYKFRGLNMKLGIPPDVSLKYSRI